jgi:1-acyl-sn-glycerol-3-phosphate acyltransferase
MNRLVLMVLKNILRVPGLYIRLRKLVKHRERYSEQEIYDHIRRIMTLAVDAGNIDLRVSGMENIPKEDGFLICGNHQGLFDVMAIVCSFRGPLAAVYKKELVGIPFIQDIAEGTDSFPMDRDDVRQSLTVIQKVTEELKKGRNYLIFPEGTRSKRGNIMGAFHAGSFRCATKARAPILPVAFVDCFKVLDQKGSKPVTVQMHYLKPIRFEEYRDLKTTELADLVKSRIAAVIEEQTGCKQD